VAKGYNQNFNTWLDFITLRRDTFVTLEAFLHAFLLGYKKSCECGMSVSIPQAHALLLRAVEQEFPILVTNRINQARRFRRDEDFPSIQELIDDPSDANKSANKTLQDGVSFENEGRSAASASSGC
jgi:hypothetical protein